MQTTKDVNEVHQITSRLAEPFPPHEIKVKPAMVKNNRALALHYIDSRLVMDRLDEVVGINGWHDSYTVLPNGEVECRLSVKIAGEWITKSDVGGQSEQPDEGDRMKAAYSDALKRAAVKFGIGRFLYRLPQQWMDYDPIKKQIIRPNPPPAKPQPQASKPANGVNPIVSNILTQLRNAASRADGQEPYRQYAEGMDQGTFTVEEEKMIRDELERFGKRFPKQPQTT